MQKSNTILAACVAALCIAITMSLCTPSRFEKEMARRETDVKQRLVMIRHAEERFLQHHGTYAADFPALVRGGYLADSLQYVPHSGGLRFSLTTDMLTAPSGRMQPVMECGTQYHVYLRGLDLNAIDKLTTDAQYEGRYPGLRIGDLTPAGNNRGNWE